MYLNFYILGPGGQRGRGGLGGLGGLGMQRGRGMGMRGRGAPRGRGVPHGRGGGFRNGMHGGAGQQDSGKDDFHWNGDGPKGRPQG